MGFLRIFAFVLFFFDAPILGCLAGGGARTAGRNGRCLPPLSPTPQSNYAPQPGRFFLSIARAQKKRKPNRKRERGKPQEKAEKKKKSTLNCAVPQWFGGALSASKSS